MSSDIKKHAYPTYKITFRVIHDNEEHVIQTRNMEYRDLRLLLQDRLYLDGFGECGGMGRCATCMISIDLPEESLSNLRRNEENTLKKFNADSGIRLACQIPIDDELSNRTIRF